MRPWRALLFSLAVSVAPASLAQEAPAKAPIDLNTASEHELESLPGIGQKKAQAIIELRRKKPLTRLTQLTQVRGIGKKTLERLKPFVKIDPVLPGSPAAGSKTTTGSVPTASSTSTTGSASTTGSTSTTGSAPSSTASGSAGSAG